MTQVFPRKLFYKINEVAEIVGVEPYVLRYWETKFPMLKPERYGNDERRYRSRDIDLLLRIRSLLYDEKFTIAGAVERIRKDPSGSLDSGIVATPHPEAPLAAVAAPPEPTVAESAQLQLFSAEPSAHVRELRRALADIRAELTTLTQQLGQAV